MKELTVIEMDNVSGAGIMQILNGSQDLLAGLVDATVGAAIGLIGYASGGGLQGGLTGNGSGGGLLGFGTISMGIGALWGAIQGGIFGTIMGAYNGADYVNGQITRLIDGILDGTAGGFKAN